jgi:hypothetical protein
MHYLDDALIVVLDEQRGRFIARFGRDPFPHDRVFFDPNADPPRALDEWSARAEFVRSMQQAGVEPAIVRAFERTGLVVTHVNLPNLSDDDLTEW